MKQWREYSHKLALDEMLRLEGQGTHAGAPCRECSGPHPLYRCTDCFGHELFSQHCILSMHWHSPFHIIEVSHSLISTLSSIENLWQSSIGMKTSLSVFPWSPSVSAFSLVITLELCASTLRHHQTTTLSLSTAMGYMKLHSTIAAVREPSQQRSSSFDRRCMQPHFT